MLEKNRIIRIDVFNGEDKLLISSSDFTFSSKITFANTFQLIMVKGNELEILPKDTKLKVIVHHTNNERTSYKVRVSLSTEYQINMVVLDGPVKLLERRKYYKVSVDLTGEVHIIDTGDKVVQFDKPLIAKMENISIGGAYLSLPFGLDIGNIATIRVVLCDEPVMLMVKVVRKQKNSQKGNDVGYGCEFVNFTTSDEEKLGKYIFTQQIKEKNQIKRLIETR